MDFKSIYSWYVNTSWHQWWVNTVWGPSWTAITAGVYGIPAGLVVAFEQLSKLANDNTISTYLSQMNVPNWVPMGLAGIALVHYIAKGHDA